MVCVLLCRQGSLLCCAWVAACSIFNNGCVMSAMAYREHSNMSLMPIWWLLLLSLSVQEPC
jgi:hypothetical protein